MKKIYLFPTFLLLFSLGFSQSVIVTVDRANIIGPTDTGNADFITSIGLTRGVGINRRSGADEFNSRDWDASSQATAETNDEYVEWSVTSSSNYEVEVTELDIRLRASDNGPSDWQIFYSTDNFATAGTALGTSQTSPLVSTDYNFNSLSINSGISGTITFRLYAWGPSTGSGWFRIATKTAWSDFGIAKPGLRMWGNITTTSINSTESNISASTFDEPDNIDYSLYSATSGLTTVNSIKIGEYIIQDGGDDLTDADLVNTILTDLEFDVTGFNNIAALALFDGTTNVSENTSIGATTSFNAINSGTGIIATDESSKTFDVYATFNNSVVDNEQIQLTISSASSDGINGSIFETLNAGGASTSTIGDDNRIEVMATTINFNQNTSDVNQFEQMRLSPSVIAIDINSNIDFDFTNSITITSTGTLDPSSTVNVNAINGESIFNNLVFSARGTGLTLTASTAGFSPVLSSTFDVIGPIITLAIQDFDGTTPEWTYSNDIPFFDNGWGTDGYYGLIDVSSASPLDYSSFSSNILGENDLEDEGENGTADFATISFDTIDISSYDNVNLSFDWQVIGYNANPDDAQYELIYDGIGQGYVFLHDGNDVPTDGSGSISLDIPLAINTIALRVRIRNNGITGYSGFDNFKVTSVFDGLLYTNSTWTPNAPDGSTGTDNALILDGSYIINSDIVINDMFVTDDGAITIEKSNSLTVNGNFDSNNNVTLESDSNEYSSLIIDGNVSGNVIYNRYVNTNANGNDLISAPVTGETFGVFASNNSNIFENPSNTTEKLFGPFDKTTGTYLTYDTAIPAEANVVLDAGTGYRAASSDGSTFTFSGLVNTGNINVGIVNSGPNNPEWNLIGNPYPSYIKLSDFLAANNTQFDPLSAGIYGYDGNASDGWNIWNQAYSDANPNAVITPGQGFLVASVTGGGTMAFTPSMRSIGDTDDFIAGRSARDTPIVWLKLQINSSAQSYNTDFYFTDNASQGLDPGYDAGSFGGAAPEFSVYSHLVQDNNGLDMAIQSLGYTDLTDITIPLGINVLQGQQVTVSIANTTLPETIDVYLEDSLTNTFTLLNTSDYTFTAASTLSETGRFFIHYTEQSLSTIESEFNSLQIYATVTPKALFIKGQLSGNTVMRLFDIQGRLVLKTILDSSRNSNQINVSNLGTGVYVVQLSNNSQNKTQKVIIK